MSRRKTNPDFLTGVPELLVLQLISRKPMHGYAVVQSIKLRSDGKLNFGEGSIYPVLHRLENDGMLASQKIEFRGRDRVVYSITDAGANRLQESQTLWQQVVGAVTSVLSGDEDDRAVA